MKTRHLLALPALVASISLFAGVAAGQAPNGDADVDIFASDASALDGLEDVILFDTQPEADPPVAQGARFSETPSSSGIRRSRMSAAEIRQARALYQARQRTARLEYNLWMGYEPLRPNWNAVPMMTSRYSNRRIYVPMYVYPSR